jgi:hypothetical protein
MCWPDSLEMKMMRPAPMMKSGLPGYLDTPTSKVLEAAKETMRDHFRRRASEKALGLVAQWQREKVYPYEGQPATAIEEAERQVFNVVALNVNHFLPKFQESDEKNKRLQLRLLRHSIQHAPADLSKILTEVLDLPVEKQQEGRIGSEVGLSPLVATVPVKRQRQS